MDASEAIPNVTQVRHRRKLLSGGRGVTEVRVGNVIAVNAEAGTAQVSFPATGVISEIELDQLENVRVGSPGRARIHVNPWNRGG